MLKINELFTHFVRLTVFILHFALEFLITLTGSLRLLQLVVKLLGYLREL